jgi:hypothetical protein
MDITFPWLYLHFQYSAGIFGPNSDLRGRKTHLSEQLKYQKKRFLSHEYLVKILVIQAAKTYHSKWGCIENAGVKSSPSADL